VRKVLTNFYSDNEIADAKKQLIMLGSDMANCEFATERRSLTQRSASEVEIDDIIGLFDILDCGTGLLGNVKFAACNYDCLPAYGLKDLNSCAIAYRQSRTESAIAALSTKVDLLASSSQPAAASVGPDNIQIVEMVDKKIPASTRAIQDQLGQLAAVCSQMKVSNSSNSTSDDPPLNDMRQRHIDRTRNVVVSGIAENRDDTIWQSTMVDVLCKAAGRTVQILDVFRIGNRFDVTKTRPILIKLQSVWDECGPCQNS